MDPRINKLLTDFVIYVSAIPVLCTMVVYGGSAFYLAGDELELRPGWHVPADIVLRERVERHRVLLGQVDVSSSAAAATADALGRLETITGSGAPTASAATAAGSGQVIDNSAGSSTA